MPAGESAEKALIAAGVYEQLRGENRLAIAKNARQALMFAERGEVDAAFVYRTDALLARKVVILFGVHGQRCLYRKVFPCVSPDEIHLTNYK